MIRRPYVLRLVGGPHNGQRRTVTDVTLPMSYTDWDPATGKLALYRPSYDGAMAMRLDGGYRFTFVGLTAPPFTVARGDQMGPCPYCGQTYSKNAAPKHFIPCNTCGSLEHAGCRH